MREPALGEQGFDQRAPDAAAGAEHDRHPGPGRRCRGNCRRPDRSPSGTVPSPAPRQPAEETRDERPDGEKQPVAQLQHGQRPGQRRGARRPAPARQARPDLDEGGRTGAKPAVAGADMEPPQCLWPRHAGGQLGVRPGDVDEAERAGSVLAAIIADLRPAQRTAAIEIDGRRRGLIGSRRSPGGRPSVDQDWGSMGIDRIVNRPDEESGGGGRLGFGRAFLELGRTVRRGRPGWLGFGRVVGIRSCISAGSGRRSGSGVRDANSFVQKCDARPLARVRVCAGGNRSCKKRRAAAHGSGSRVRATGGCVRVRAAWRPLGGRMKSLAPCHKPAAESRAALTGR